MQHLGKIHANIGIVSDCLIPRVRLLKAGYFFSVLTLRYQSMNLENIYHLGLNQN